MKADYRQSPPMFIKPWGGDFSFSAFILSQGGLAEGCQDIPDKRKRGNVAVPSNARLFCFRRPRMQGNFLRHHKNLVFTIYIINLYNFQPYKFDHYA